MPFGREDLREVQYQFKKHTLERLGGILLASTLAPRCNNRSTISSPSFMDEAIMSGVHPEPSCKCSASAYVLKVYQR